MSHARRRRGAQRVLVLANPSRHSSDEDDSPPKASASGASGNTSTTSLTGHAAPVAHHQHQHQHQHQHHHTPQPQPRSFPTGSHHHHPHRQGSSPLSDLSSLHGDGHRPSPVPAVDFPPHPPPSDASSRSESTPPPATPAFALPAPPEFASSHGKANVSPRHAQREQHVRQPSDSRSTASPRSPMPPLAQEKVMIMATMSETFSFIDITGARNADFIRERIFSSLQISDHDQARFAIYKTDTGEWPPAAPALPPDELLRVCQTEGDHKGSLKFLVAAPSASPPRLAPINTATIPLPIPPASVPAFPIPKPARSHADPSISSSVSGGGYTASDSEPDPDPRKHRVGLRHGGWSNSPPSAVSGSPVRVYPAGPLRQQYRPTSPSPTTGLPPHPASRRQGGASLNPNNADYYGKQPLPPTPSGTSSSRQNSAESGLLHVHSRPGVTRRPSTGPKKSSRNALPIPPPPKAPAPSAPHNAPFSPPSGWSPQARAVDPQWLLSGQATKRPTFPYGVSPGSSKQSSPSRLKPAKSFDMLNSAAAASSTPQRHGRPPQSAEPGNARPALQALQQSSSGAGRPAWSDTDARGPAWRPNSSGHDSSSSNDYGEATRVDSPTREDEDTLKADKKPTFAFISGGPPQLPPISTDMLSLPMPMHDLASADDEGDTIWVRPPQQALPQQSQATPPSASKLLSPRDPDEDTIWVRPPEPAIQLKIEDAPVAPSPASASPVDSLPRLPKPRPQSRFINRASVTWNVRPPPQEVYENLEEFFPEHDLDKPLITVDGGAGGDSGGSPNTPVSATAVASPLTRGGAQMKHRKTIRNVASQGKKYMDKSAKIESPEAAMRRKRSTKLWGTKVEEVTPGAGRSGPSSSVPESPSSSAARPVTRWIKGDLIGKGTYGKVYLALNGNTGEMIAVKQVELPKTASDKADARQTTVVDAIKSESNVLRDLDHPNVVQYLGFEETADYFNLFLEYVPGGSIGGVLRKVGKFDEEVAKSFTYQMLSGLEYLHSRGIWHRDLKGDNILVDPSGICKISDFGISKRTADAEKFDTAATNMQGSIFWMAPEVLHHGGQGYNAKVDIWSLGCVYVEMMTGRRPWQDDNFVAVMYKVGTAKEAPPIPNLSDIGRDFSSLCFEKDPIKRPTASTLRQHAYLIPKPGWTFSGFTGTS